MINDSIKRLNYQHIYAIILKEIIFKDFFMQSVVITGGNGGIGSAVVNYFLQNGYRVFCLDITKNSEKQENLISIICDITSEQSVKNAFEIVAKNTSEISAVINLAGVYRMDSLIEIDFERLKNTYDINLFGACLVNKIFFPEPICYGNEGYYNYNRSPWSVNDKMKSYENLFFMK
jgi:NAD(P)-dependent dehydrogenase (short-subunit alcohol dehydrogenase family)